MLHYSNYVYHQDDEFDMMQDGVGIVEAYEDWEGGEEHLDALSDEDYNCFIQLVEEGEEVSTGQHVATIKTKDEDYSDDYWVILVENCDGFIHEEIKNGKVHIIEAEIYGKGINMFLLSQGHHVKALAAESFVEEMRTEIEKMIENHFTKF